MAFYMFTGSYTTDAIKTMVDNPQDREAAGRAAIEDLAASCITSFSPSVSRM